MRFIIFAAFFGFLGSAQAATQLGDLVKANAQTKPYCGYVDDNICYMTQEKAEQYCTDLGQHLPTAKELAQYAQTTGAKGLVSNDLCTSDENCLATDYLNSDGNVETFNYSYTGYQGLNEHVWYWSASTFAALKEAIVPVVFYSDDGEFMEDVQGAGSIATVRCVTAQ